MPGQPLPDTGVTVMFATTGTDPVLIAVNEDILPVPLAANPIDVLSFVQLKVVPNTRPPKVTDVVPLPFVTTWSVG